MRSPSRPWAVTNSGALPVDVVLRSIAITCVVFNHVHWVERGFDFGGGLNALFILNGYSLARFALNTQTTGAASRKLLRIFLNIVGPTFAVLLMFSMYHREFDAAALLFFSNFVGHFGKFTIYTWYVQVLGQITLVLALVIVIPGVGDVALRRPYLAALIGFGLAVAILYIAQSTSATPEGLNPRPQFHAWNLMLGVVVYFLLSQNIHFKSLHKMGLIVVSLTIAVWYWAGTDQVLRPYFLMLALVGLFYVPFVRLPKVPRQLCLLIAQSTFFIFLLHGMFIVAFEMIFPKQPDAYPLWHTLGSWSLGVFGPVMLWILWTATKRTVAQHAKQRKVAATDLRPVSSSSQS